MFSFITPEVTLAIESLAILYPWVVPPEEFKEIKNAIRYDFVQDNYFQELKEAEITRERLSTLREVEEHVGTYYSREWVLRSVLRMSEEEMKDMKDQIQAEAKENPPEEAEE